MVDRRDQSPILVDYLHFFKWLIHHIPVRYNVCSWQAHMTSLYILNFLRKNHYNDVIMGNMASQITSLTIVYSTVYLCADLRKHRSSAPLDFVRGIHRGPVNFPRKGPGTRKFFHLMTSSWSSHMSWHFRSVSVSDGEVTRDIVKISI